MVVGVQCLAGAAAALISLKLSLQFGRFEQLICSRSGLGLSWLEAERCLVRKAKRKAG